MVADECSRAGIPADSEEMKTLIRAAMKAQNVDIFGFYSREPTISST